MTKKKNISYILQEIVIVVIGIIIAVSIGNYRDTIANNNYIAKTLLAVEKEIKLSRIEVDSVLVRHTQMMQSLENDIDNNDDTLVEYIGRLGGVQFPVIKNISLRFFISNKAELVDFELISRLLEIEDQTKVLTSKMDRLADYSYQHLNNKNKEIKLSFAYLLADVIDSEEALIQLYGETIQEIKKSN